MNGKGLRRPLGAVCLGESRSGYQAFSQGIGILWFGVVQYPSSAILELTRVCSYWR